MFLTLFWLAAGTAHAQPELVSTAELTTRSMRLHAELYYDKDRKVPDLTVEFRQSKTSDQEADQFIASSLPPPLAGGADWQLRAAPVSRVDGSTLFIYSAFRPQDNVYDNSRSFALVFRAPATDLDKDGIAYLRSHFPRTVVTDSSGKPRYVKAVLVRLTPYQAFPVAAFDLELAFPGPG